MKSCKGDDLNLKIESLVRRGYTQVAFRYKTNATKFAKLWKDKGYKISYRKSHGPVVEGGGSMKAYYMTATKNTKK